MFNTLAMLTALAAPPVPAHAPTAAVVAGVEIGAKAAKGVVLGEPLGGAPRVLWSKSLEPTPLANLSPDVRMTDDAVRRTARAVAELVRAIRTEFDVPDGRIFVVASSSVSAAGNRDALAAGVRRETGLTVQFLTADDEAALVHRGLVPSTEQRTAMSADVGSGNTRVAAVGWSSGIGAWRVSGTVGAGTVTSADRATDADRTGDSWAKGLVAERTELRKQIGAMADRQPTLVYHRAKCYLTGGAVWALVSATKPGAVRDPFVQFSAADIDALERALAVRPGDLPVVHFGAIADPAVRAEAEREWQRVKDTFSARQLSAGCAILHELSTAYQFDRKELVFVRGGQFAWITALLARETAPPAPVAVPMTSSLPCLRIRSR